MEGVIKEKKKGLKRILRGKVIVKKKKGCKTPMQDG